MHVLIGGQKVNLTEGAGGRLQATFTATDDTQSIRIPSDCIGTLNVNDIQLEQGSQATSFVEPAVQSEDVSGIFKDLRDLRIDIKDTEEGLSHQITINQEGLEQLISDTEERLDSRITLTADTWQGELSDAKQGLNNQITATASLWQTKLSDTEQELRSAIQLKADSLITLIEDTDSNNFTKTEQLVSGLQTTVQGDLRSQRTQLENLISSSIESATGSKSTIWQTLNSHGSQISNAQGDINRVEQTISGYSRRLSDVEGNYSSIEQTVSGLNTEVNGYYGGVQSRFRQLEGLIDARVTRSDVEGIIQNSGDNIWLAIGSRVQSVADNATMSGYEIMSEINLQANRQIFRVGDNRLMITEDTTYLDNSVIKSAHIADLAVTGAKIADASISSAKIINLDADQITGNTTNFIMSNWNSISGGDVRITGSGVLSNGIDGSYANISSGEMRSYSARDHASAVIGQGRAQFFTESNSLFIAGRDIHGSYPHGVISASHNRDLAIGRYDAFVADSPNFVPYIRLRYADSQNESSGYISVDKDSRFYADTWHAGNNITGVYQVRFGSGGYIDSTLTSSTIRINSANNITMQTANNSIAFEANDDAVGINRPLRMQNNNKILFETGGEIRSSTTSNMAIESSRHLLVFAQGSLAITLDNSRLYMENRDLDMKNNIIRNNSDIRLKNNIVKDEIDSLSAINSWDFIGFDWKDNRNKERQFGVSAQSAGDIAIHGGDYLSVDSTKQLNMTSHAVQQLSRKVKLLEKKVKKLEAK